MRPPGPQGKMKTTFDGEAAAMKRFSILAMVAALCGVVPAIALGQISSAQEHVTIAINSQNDSGEKGTATLQQSGPDLLVHVRVVDPTAETQPIHIHKGTCANLNPVPSYPLTPVRNRRSYTKVKNLQLSALLASPYAINIHKSPQQAAIYVACGNILK
jgi:hypothetical protein